MQRAILLFAFLAAAHPAQAQQRSGGPGQISGIIASESGQPLASAAVTIRNAADSSTAGGTVSGSDGRFSVAGLKLGTYAVRVTFVGYKPHNVLHIVLSDKEQHVELGTLKLSVAPVELAQVEATAAKAPVVVEADRTIHDTKDMVAAKSGKAIDVLRAVPELEVDMNGKVTMRGNQAVTIQINGRATPLKGDALTNYLQQMPGDRVAKVEVIANPSAKYDPEGQGGIVNIVMKDNADLGLSGNFSLNGSTRLNRGGGARINYQKGRLTFFTGGNFNFNDSKSNSYDLRRNLLASPITLFEQNGTSQQNSHFDSFDLTSEFRVGKQAHFWAEASTWGNGSNNDNLTAFGIMNDARELLDSYNRANTSSWSWLSGEGAVGFKQVFQPNKHEITFEARRDYSTNANDNSIRKLLTDPTLPVGLTHTNLDQNNAENSFSVDYTRAVKKGKLDAGGRLARRENDYDNLTDIFANEQVTSASTSTRNKYQYHEDINSAYATFSQPLKKFGFTGGVRGEIASTGFKLPTTFENFNNSYRTLFPSAAVSYDFGHGTTLRLNYGKRIGRPWPDILNPYIPVTDPLNRQVGNPYLKPNYTHSITADLNKIGKKGTLRLSTYYRHTVDQWTNIKRVDTLGVSTVTWENLADMQTYGTSMTGSLRPAGRMSGSLTLNAYREIRDAGNLTQDYVRSAYRWSAGANAQVKLNATTNAQMNVNYRPAQTLVQGRISGMVFSSLGIRQQVMDKKASWNLFVNDPLDLYRYNFTTNDRTHEQLSKTTFKVRQASLSFTYNWGKPPQQQSRRSSQDSGPGAETVQIR